MRQMRQANVPGDTAHLVRAPVWTFCRHRAGLAAGRAGSSAERANQGLGQLPAIHWSVPDPVPAGDPGSFDAALAVLGQRVERFAPRLAAAP